MNKPSITPSTAVLAGAILALSTMPATASTPPDAARTAACAWTVASAPELPGSSILYGIHAITADDVWAVGKFGDILAPDTLAEHWDGSAWSVVSTPDPRRHSNDGNVLDAVDATGPNDVWAVGSHIVRGGIDTRPFIVHFDGAQWRQVPPPSGRFPSSTLTGVAALAPDDVWIVGITHSGHPPIEAPLAMHWDGTAWHVVRTPNPSGDRDDELTGVSAVGPNDIWAVGEAGERHTLTMHFDGHRWRTVRSPNPPGDARNSLTGVVARAADDVWAVGTGGVPNSGISEHWDGASWKLVPMQKKGMFEEMAGVTARDDGTVWAVGLVRPSTPKYQTLAERYDGSTWSIVKTPSLDAGDQLEGVTASGDDIWSVGVTAAGPDFQPGTALILHGC